ncbi:hypothetical protein BGX38DRAFT_1327552 [Terfezia claveryi]|nr:hypothetical protein BGX38DRAFT_1327552 [Terfezia claveryi]
MAAGRSRATAVAGGARLSRRLVTDDDVDDGDDYEDDDDDDDDGDGDGDGAGDGDGDGDDGDDNTGEFCLGSVVCRNGSTHRHKNRETSRT